MCFLHQHFLSEFGGDLLVKYPELVNGERIEMRGVHGSIPNLGQKAQADKSGIREQTSPQLNIDRAIHI